MTPPPNLPAGYEEVTAPFLREHGAVEGMLWITKGASIECWSNYAEEIGFEKPEHQKVALTCGDYDFCAPTGTIAAATTPLPEPRCDCAYGRPPFVAFASTQDGCSPTCASRLRYRHVLPGELAKLPTKPEGLLKASRGKNDWHEVATWPLIQRFVDGVYDFAYAIPLPPQPDKEELPNAECPHCSGWNHVSKVYCHNCGGKLPAHPDFTPPQPEKGKGGEAETFPRVDISMLAKDHAILSRDPGDDVGTTDATFSTRTSEEVKPCAPHSAQQTTQPAPAIQTPFGMTETGSAQVVGASNAAPKVQPLADAATHTVPDDEIRIRIAEWCGLELPKRWKFRLTKGEDHWSIDWHSFTAAETERERIQAYYPDAVEKSIEYIETHHLPAYTTSLDAIASAEARLTEEQAMKFYVHLATICRENKRGHWSTNRIHASAHSRALALLRIINPKLP